MKARGSGPIRVLVVDDSAMMRELLTQLLNSDPEVCVVGTASDGRFVEARLSSLQPDVMTLDLDMPGMGGLEVLRTVVSNRRLPVVVVSAATGAGATGALSAMGAGAVSCIGKPEADAHGDLSGYAEQLCARVKEAAHARVENQALTSLRPAKAGPSGPPAMPQRRSHAHERGRYRIVAIGASTGGTVALERILRKMVADGPPVLITQHISARFSAPLARRLDTLGAVRVSEACDGQAVLPGHAYVAPGDRHLCLHRQAGGYVCRLSDAPPVNRHRPSVDVMFRSVADIGGATAAAILLTGMGRDGARGMYEVRRRGGFTVAQDEASSVIWGMPKAAIEAGGACTVLSLSEITSWLSTRPSFPPTA